MLKAEPLQLIQGYYAILALRAFHNSGLLTRLRTPQSLTALAREFEYEPDVLAPLLDYLVASSDLVVQTRDRKYRLRGRYVRYRDLGFHIDKFLNGYGSAVEAVAERSTPRTAARLVNHAALADAFSRIEPSSKPTAIAQIVTALNASCVVDLGCGVADRLIDICQNNEHFSGVGVDSSNAMCRIARRRVSERGLQKRVRILCRDARLIGSALSLSERAQVDLIVAASLLNEFCDRRGVELVRLLKRLGKLFPGRLMLIDDYYGVLHRKAVGGIRYTHSLVHDVAQLASGQGVPFGDFESWRSIYERAHCTVVRKYEGTASGFHWFVHVVRLPEA